MIIPSKFSSAIPLSPIDSYSSPIFGMLYIIRDNTFFTNRIVFISESNLCLIIQSVTFSSSKKYHASARSLAHYGVVVVVSRRIMASTASRSTPSTLETSWPFRKKTKVGKAEISTNISKNSGSRSLS